MNMSQDIKMQMVDDNVEIRCKLVEDVGSLCQQTAFEAKEIGCCLSSATAADFFYAGFSLKRKKQGSKSLKRNLSSWLLQMLMKKHRDATSLIRKNQKKYKENAKNSKELGSKEVASSRPSKPRTCLRWIPTGRIFAMCGKLTASSNTENKSEKSVCDNASTSNPSEPSSKGFPISTSLLGRLSRLRKQHTSIYPIVVL
ncbi:hypothetical protein Tco_0977142 [Tanacetum coccineum]|uniref:Uncharacterized protein n=1 Tax=Tanacetum coccineum TaxID=301880 RepID=A0ABQ5EJ84_9ASTR